MLGECVKVRRRENGKHFCPPKRYYSQLLHLHTHTHTFKVSTIPIHTKGENDSDLRASFLFRDHERFKGQTANSRPTIGHKHTGH